MNLRGTSFGDHGKELAAAVFSPFDDWMLRNYGFTIADVFTASEAIEDLVNDSINTLGEYAREFAEGVVNHLADRSRVPPEWKSKLKTAAGRQSVGRVAFTDVFFGHLRDAATFTIDDLCAARPDLDSTRIAAVLSELSIEPGALPETEYTGLFDPSPLVEHPILRHGDRYIVPVPGMLLRDVFTVFDARLMRVRPGYSKSRALTLDTLAVHWLQSMLPGSTAYTNLKYNGAEVDGLVLFEDVAFVVEGKGSDLSFQARRGDVKRLTNEIRRSVGEAFKQGDRVREFILGPGDSVFVDEDQAEVVRIPEGLVSEVLIVNPTIHELGGHAPQLPRLRARGLFVAGETPWSIYINDLRVIAETCDNPAIFLHYLVWRSRLPLGDQVIVLDELDLWGAYLFGARLPPLDPNGKHQIGNSTTDFDAYYDGLMGRGPAREPPRKYLEEPAVSFIDRLALERPPGWRQAAGVILDLSIPELAFVCAKAKEVGRAADDRHRAEAHFGRGVLVGVPRSADIDALIARPGGRRRDVSFIVYATAAGKHGRLVWATYGADVNLELSDFERAMASAIPSVFSD
jgi:hypothetical protein